MARDPFALEQLYDGVRARMADDGGALVDQPFGRRAHTKQLGDAARITWAYGDPNGDLGPIVAPRRPGGTPGRPLGMVRELFTCRITGRDRNFASDDPGFERAQYVATRALFDRWFDAVYLQAFGMFELRSARWLTLRNESLANATLEVVGAIQAAIPDADVPETGTDTAADAQILASDMITIVETEHIPGAVS